MTLLDWYYRNNDRLTYGIQPGMYVTDLWEGKRSDTSGPKTQMFSTQLFVVFIMQTGGIINSQKLPRILSSQTSYWGSMWVL